AHSIQPLSNVATSAIGLVLMATGHSEGWPISKGGSDAIANALASYFVSLGGTIETNFYVRSLSQLPSSHAVLFDITPMQLLQIAGYKFSSLYRWQLKRYRYGMGVFKIDWALDGPIPFTASACRQAGTIHLGNTLEEIVASEQSTSEGKHPDKPFVLLAQQSVFDPSRAPEGKQTAWAYCHVPNGSEVDMTERIEEQVERFAPHFRDRIIGRHVMNTAQIEAYNPNYIGGDINGGVIDIGQLFTRPALRLSPYKTSEKGIYICSSSTPPGGGVHGMCGYHAAKRVLKDVFKLQAQPVQ
ncbi:MAG: NAD(P)/FAD-dependent oxidoreductase, partial [Flavisolibacter sp.]|nr:NAD(P)/FAD-dependent oxidoreductase [Flavisolibacter sp.]